MNTVLFVNATIGFSENLFLVQKISGITAAILLICSFFSVLDKEAFGIIKT